MPALIVGITVGVWCASSAERMGVVEPDDGVLVRDCLNGVCCQKRPSMSSDRSTSSTTAAREMQGLMVSADSASAHPETHARFELQGGPPYSLDAILHVSRYVWAAELFVQPEHHVLDFGCGTGFGVALLSPRCAEVVGIDLDPNVVGLGEKFQLTNSEFLCANACEPNLGGALGIRHVDVVLSMETIEHLEDYFTYVENAVSMMKPTGTLVVGTPNRTMTYNRYEDRRHMDPSHVQEFTARSLERTLGAYFNRVEMYYQYFPNFWDDAAQGIPRTLTFEDVAFHRITDVPDLATDAFALVAVATQPK
jgi:2-polyprenyl-3-methyl-5-hydroxy-6-metoxy-1,4-benzoquinol methylase